MQGLVLKPGSLSLTKHNVSAIVSVNGIERAVDAQLDGGQMTIGTLRQMLWQAHQAQEISSGVDGHATRWIREPRAKSSASA